MFDRFWCHLGAPFGTQNPPKRVARERKIDQKVDLGPRWVPRGPQTPPRRPRGPISNDFLSILGLFFNDFLSFSKHIFHDFKTDFCHSKLNTQQSFFVSQLPARWRMAEGKWIYIYIYIYGRFSSVDMSRPHPLIFVHMYI